jgi:hypothetical protein
MLIVTLFSLKLNIFFTLTTFLLLTYIQDPDPHSFSKLDPDKDNADLKHCFAPAPCH